MKSLTLTRDSWQRPRIQRCPSRILDGPRLHGSRLLGRQLRRNGLEEGAHCSCGECRRKIRHPRFGRSQMGTRHAAGAGSPRTHDLDIPGGIHELHSRAIQPHRCDSVVTPLTPSADCPTSKDEIGEMANRPYREPVGALAFEVCWW